MNHYDTLRVTARAIVAHNSTGNGVTSRVRELEMMQVAVDICRVPTHAHQSPQSRHAWIATERARLGIDAAVGEWKGKPLLYHLKANPHRFLRCMALMSTERAAGGR